MEASILEYLDRRLPGNWYNLSVEDRRRLFAHRDKDGSLHFDVHLAGSSQSVFFTYSQ